MALDLIVKGGTLPDGSVADIGISGEKIAAIEPRLDAEASRVIDATGNLVSPPFVDPHFHMDGRFPTAFRASTPPGPCWRASRYGAN